MISQLDDIPPNVDNFYFQKKIMMDFVAAIDCNTQLFATLKDMKDDETATADCDAQLFPTLEEKPRYPSKVVAVGCSVGVDKAGEKVMKVATLASSEGATTIRIEGRYDDFFVDVIHPGNAVGENFAAVDFFMEGGTFRSKSSHDLGATLVILQMPTGVARRQGSIEDDHQG